MKHIHTQSEYKPIDTPQENIPSQNTEWIVASIAQNAKEAIEVVNKPKQIIIAMIGPPNSGKSVFSTSLKLHIGRHLTYLIRACPDGEWDWRQMAQTDVANYCVEKSKLRMGDKLYDPALVDWYEKSIQNCASIPFLMVDLGWKITDENKQLLRSATHCIIICRKDNSEDKENWIKCAQSCEVPILAEIDSVQNKEEITYEVKEGGTFHGQSANLDRGTIATGGTIIELAKHIKTMVNIPDIPGEVWTLKEKDGEIFEELDVSELNKVLNIENKIRIQNGREISYPMWTQDDMYRFKEMIPSIAHSSDHRLHINGACPKFLQAYIASTFDGDISVSDPKIPGWVIYIQRGLKKNQEQESANLSYHLSTVSYEWGAEKNEVYLLEVSIATSDKIIHNLQEEVDSLSLQHLKIDQNGEKVNFLAWWNQRSDIEASLETQNAVLQKGIVLSEKLPLPLTSKLVRELQGITSFIAIHTPQQSQVERRNNESLAMIVTGARAGEYISLPIMKALTPEKSK